MKTFAIMLLMLCSFSFLKAQTMVVETADSVESFEVREIKGFSAFKKDFRQIKIEFKNIPIILQNRGSEQNLNYSYSSETTENYKKFFSRKDTLFYGTSYTFMHLIFIKEKETDLTGNSNKTYILFDTNSAIINKLRFTTGGIMGGCWDGNRYHCSNYGSFDILFSNLNYNADSVGNSVTKLTGIEISKRILSFKHEESKMFYEEPYTDYSIYVKKIREEDLTDESQIIITIE